MTGYRKGIKYHETAGLRKVTCLGILENHSRRRPQHDFWNTEHSDVDKKGSYGVLQEEGKAGNQWIEVEG